jgi:spermidine synthase
MTDRLRRLPALALLLFAGLCGTAGAAQKLVHSERSLYREVLVYEDGSERCMCFTRQCRIGRQSCIDVRHPERFALNYTRMMLGGMLFSSPDPKRVLLVGLGGGSIPTALREILPDARIDIVEIDPAVTRVARRFFDFKDDARIRVEEVSPGQPGLGAAAP